MKSNPIPTRFLAEEYKFLEEASQVTGLTVSELVRRSVRLLRNEYRSRNGWEWIVELPPIRTLDPAR